MDRWLFGINFNVVGYRRIDREEEEKRLYIKQINKLNPPTASGAVIRWNPATLFGYRESCCARV